MRLPPEPEPGPESTRHPSLNLEPANVCQILQHTHIDWAATSYDDKTIDELVEFLLRIIQSMVIAPPDPARTGRELRDYLRRRIGPDIDA